jgi:hypothetical protein
MYVFYYSNLTHTQAPTGAMYLKGMKDNEALEIDVALSIMPV